MDVEMRWETKKCIEAAFRDEHRRHGPLEAVHSHFRKGKEKKQQWRVNFNCPLGSNCCEGYAKDRVTKCWTAESTNSGVAAALSQAAYHRHKQCFEAIDGAKGSELDEIDAAKLMIMQGAKIRVLEAEVLIAAPSQTLSR